VKATRISRTTQTKARMHHNFKSNKGEKGGGRGKRRGEGEREGLSNKGGRSESIQSFKLENTADDF
jgi:hypothetical protein